jgi:hypothetical protein
MGVKEAPPEPPMRLESLLSIMKVQVLLFLALRATPLVRYGT